MLIAGSYTAGKVDVVPGLFHVVTNFFHLYYAPLFPMGSYLVMERQAPDQRIPPTEENKLAIPLSGKSILVGWIRAGCAFALCVIVLTSVLSFNKNQNKPLRFHMRRTIVPGAIEAAIALSILGVTYAKRFTQASHERAVELARLSGYGDVGMLMVEVALGRLTAEEADAELERRENLSFDDAVAQSMH